MPPSDGVETLFETETVESQDQAETLKSRDRAEAFIECLEPSQNIEKLSRDCLEPRHSTEPTTDCKNMQ